MKNFLDKEYFFDYLKWVQFVDQTPNKLLLQEVFTKQDPLLSYFYALEKKDNLPKIQEIILNSKNPKYIFLFAKNIKKADCNALQTAIINTKNIKYICKYALFIKNCNFSILEKLILKSKKIKYINMLLSSNKHKNINNYFKIISICGKPKYLFFLSKFIKTKKQLSKIEDEIIKCKSSFYIRMLAAKIKFANIDKLEQAILQLGQPEEIKKFAKTVKKSKLNKFLLIS